MKGDAANKKKIARQCMPEQAPEIRKKSFEEVPLGDSPEVAVKEAERCLQCKRPSCIEGCPVEVDIPGFIRHIREGEFTESIKNLWDKKLKCET